jgi:hypothetical protein
MAHDASSDLVSPLRSDLFEVPSTDRETPATGHGTRCMGNTLRRSRSIIWQAAHHVEIIADPSTTPSVVTSARSRSVSLSGVADHRFGGGTLRPGWRHMLTIAIVELAHLQNAIAMHVIHSAADQYRATILRWLRREER